MYRLSVLHLWATVPTAPPHISKAHKVKHVFLFNQVSKPSTLKGGGPPPRLACLLSELLQKKLTKKLITFYVYLD